MNLHNKINTVMIMENQALLFEEQKHN